MISTALQSCCDGWGLTVTLGVPKVKPEVSVHYGLLLSGRTLKGSLYGGWKPKSELPLLVDMYLRKAFSFNSSMKAKHLQSRASEKEQCRLHVPTIDRSIGEPAPYVVVVHGPPKVVTLPCT